MGEMDKSGHTGAAALAKRKPTLQPPGALICIPRLSGTEKRRTSGMTTG